MKKLILFAAILFAGVSVVKAEGSQPATATDGNVTTTYGNKTSTLTVSLKPYLELAVSGNSFIEYVTKNDYTTGNFVEETNASNTLVTVNSAGAFTVSISATDLIEENTPGNALSAAHIHATATPQEGAVENTNNENTLANLNGDATLISTNKGGVDMKYKVKFRANGGELFRAAYSNGLDTKSIQNYTSTITYTIAVN